jgi:hypothetical protein
MSGVWGIAAIVEGKQFRLDLTQLGQYQSSGSADTGTIINRIATPHQSNIEIPRGRKFYLSPYRDICLRW